MDKEPLILSPDFQYTLDVLEKTRTNLFITGRAGTGKSTLLRLFRNTSRKKIVVLAPTGIAALNVQGQTIHSFFGFPPRIINPGDIKKRRFRKLYENLEVLVIDEISMVRADMLDNIDYFLRLNRNLDVPFGGVQMVFFGDLFQLPPVVSSQEEQHYFRTFYESPFFFSAQVFQSGFQMEGIELQKVYRQEERHFLRLLDAVRLNQADYDVLDDLNTRHFPNFNTKDHYITLSARNASVDRINQQEMGKLPHPAETYIAKVQGNFKPNLFPTSAQLVLKEQAQVMFIKNDPDKRFVNGSIGTISKLGDEKITVLLDGAEVEVGVMDWEIIRYKASEKEADKIESEVVGTFQQFPLKPAWAVTIHKAQGKTFDKVIIDLGKGAFEHGQTYVALSRCRTLEGIILRQAIRPQDIRVDDRIVEFYEQYFR